MKNYEDLTFADSYMFYRIIRENKEICIGLIERLLSIRVKDIKYLTAVLETIQNYEEKRSILNADIDRLLAGITSLHEKAQKGEL